MVFLIKELKIILLISFFVFSNIPLAIGGDSSQVIYIAGDGSGDFNCDGKDDHVEINQALGAAAENSESTTVYLKGPFTYIIDDTLLIGSNTILKGDPDTKVKLASQAGWTEWKPLIKERASGAHDIIIQGFTLDGNREGNGNVVSGKGYYNLIHLGDCRNISVHDMYLTNNHGDGLKVDSCSNVKFHDNEIYLLGHDALYASGCSDVQAYDNVITCRTNSALRLYNSNKASFYGNRITSEGSGGAGIEIQKYGKSVMDDIEICNNVIYKTALAGIWIFSSGPAYPLSSANVHIHHNQIFDTGLKSSNSKAGGIVSAGFNILLENNVFDGCYGSAISQKETYSEIPGSGYTITARNNIISNTRTSSGAGKGYGVFNLLENTHTFVLQNNYFFNNPGGNYKEVAASSSDIQADPLYADRNKNDYHLKSKGGRWDGYNWVADSVNSPCIDTGYIYSDYSREPEDNGNRINIGAYGNTAYASKSGDLSTDNNQAPVINPIPQATVAIGENLNFTVKAFDTDGDTLKYFAHPLPEGAEFDIKSGIFNWTPMKGQIGKYEVLFKVKDGKYEASKTVFINVIDNSSGENKTSPSEPLEISYSNRLREASPEKVFSDKPYIDAGELNNSGRYRDLIGINLSELNSKSKQEVKNASLSLFWYYPEELRQNNTVLEIYRPASAWNSDYASWNKRDNGIAWDMTGGDWYDKNGVLQGNVPYATLTIKANQYPANAYCELNITTLINEYLTGKYPNTGFLIKARNESDNYVAFYSNEIEDINHLPKLHIEFIT
ncbi:MAG: disaggregatase related repeat-containing protein [Methanosarcina sp.]